MSAPPAAPTAAQVDPPGSRRVFVRPRDVLLHPVNLVPFAVYPLYLAGRHYGFVDPRASMWLLVGSIMLAHFGSTGFALLFPPGSAPRQAARASCARDPAHRRCHLCHRLGRVARRRLRVQRRRPHRCRRLPRRSHGNGGDGGDDRARRSRDLDGLDPSAVHQGAPGTRARDARGRGRVLRDLDAVVLAGREGTVRNLVAPQ